MKKNTVITDYLYGAYGSNLNKDQMRFRCPYAKPVASYDLEGHALKFRGVADVESAERKSKFIHTHYGKVMLYVMCDQDNIYPPSDAYLNGIATGYFDFKLDNRLLKEAVTDSYISQNNGISLDYLRG